ncbi:MAG: hypothetical protein LBE99_04515 [Puniceicoccales bacterium]|jgi:hypothetical protein|nr:hypothetical protein [Puniceicoccales bacterium]
MSSSIHHSSQATSLTPIDTRVEPLDIKQQEQPSIASTGAKYLLARFFNACTFGKIGFFRNWENESARNLMNAVKTSINSKLSEVVSGGLQSLGSSIQGLPDQLKSAHWDPITSLGTEHGTLVRMTSLGNLGQLGDATTRFVVNVLNDIACAKGEFADLNKDVMGTVLRLVGTLYQENGDNKHLIDACKKLVFDKVFSSDFVLSNVLSVDRGEASVMQRFIGWLCSTSLVRNVADHLVTEHILNNSDNNLLTNEPKLFHEKVVAACLKDFQDMGGTELSFNNLKRLFSASNESLSPELRRHVEEFNRLQEALSNNLITSTLGKIVRASGALLPSEESLSNLKRTLTDVLGKPCPENYQNFAKACVRLFPQVEKLSEPVQDKIAALAVSYMQPIIQNGDMDHMHEYLVCLGFAISGTDDIMQEIARACTSSESVGADLVQSLTPRLQKFINETIHHLNGTGQQAPNVAEGVYIGGTVGFSQLNLFANNPQRTEAVCQLLRDNKTPESIATACLDLAKAWATTTAPAQMAREATRVVVDVTHNVAEAAQVAGRAVVGAVKDAASATVETVRAVKDTVVGMAQDTAEAAQALGHAVVSTVKDAASATVGVVSSGIGRLLGRDSGEDVSAINAALAPEVVSVQETFHALMAPSLQQASNRQKLEDGLRSMPRDADAEVIQKLNNTAGTETVFQDRGWTWTATYNLNPNISQALSGNALVFAHQGNRIEGKSAQEKLRSLHGVLAQGSHNDATQGIALLSNIVAGASTLLPSHFQNELDSQGLSLVTHFQGGSPANPSYSVNITNVVYGFEAMTFADHEDNVSCKVSCEYPIQTKDGQLTGERVRISFDVNLYDSPTPGAVGSTRFFNINDIRNLSSELVGS